MFRHVRVIIRKFTSNALLSYKRSLQLLKKTFFGAQCHHMSLMDFVVSPPDCGQSLTDFGGWDAYEAQLRCPDKVDGDIWSTSRGLKPKFY
jgi:hypothetical protein